MKSITELNEQFNHPGISFAEEWDGFVVVDVVNEHATARVALNGAQLLSWVPKGEQPVIWLSEDARFEMGKSVRGGVPVCWPWFGAHRIESTFPAHGFARTSEWELLSVDHDEGATALLFRLNERREMHHFWPHSFELALQITIGSELSFELKTRNCSGEAIELSEALHTYFNISDVDHVKVKGLDGLHYLDKLEDFQRKQQSGPIHIERETDRIYLNAEADSLIEDSGFNRTIRITSEGSRSTVVWNPWQESGARMGDLGEAGYRSMLCVESANAADNRLTLAPSETHTLRVTYTIEPLI
ncbi:MAG: D-hexose-6-phosphate mutarotase [Gammaproteobacteria bacterium]|nr:D-hexose-6-phosphate mutarotase [Gammaproteobacteria bacterium]